jgi:hypothetical protein
MYDRAATHPLRIAAKQAMVAKMSSGRSAAPADGAQPTGPA